MKLPILISVAHGGIKMPAEVKPYLIANKLELVKDGDEGAFEIYQPLKKHATKYIQFNYFRAIVDANRRRSDFRKDGVIKTHTCLNRALYKKNLSKSLKRKLIMKYYAPYHRKLSQIAKDRVVLGVDCHTMAAFGPPIGPGYGKKRPYICISNASKTCSDLMLKKFKKCLEASFQKKVSLNHPFKGGYIIRSHAKEIPWVQLELSRAPFMTNKQKSKCVLKALKLFVKDL